MATAAENLQTAYDNAAARLAEMDAVPLDERARMTYSENGKTYGWNEYRSSLMQQLKDLRALIASYPWNARSLVR